MLGFRNRIHRIKSLVGLWLTVIMILILVCARLEAAELGVSRPNDIQSDISEVTGQPQKRLKLIFIPGILGSKLLEPGTTREQRRYVWGGTSPDNDKLLYDGNTKLDADFFDKVDIAVLDHLFDTNVYGQALLMLRDSRDLDENDVLKFSYDWRQSNVLTADDLNTWLCKNEQALRGSQIVFVAHSMGGLVLKNWFINYFDKNRGCQPDESLWLDVDMVFFAGTPHLGSPKAVAALVGKYSLYDNWFARNILPDGIKKYGYSFDSFYELLPIQHNGLCRAFANRLGLEPAIQLAQGSGESVDVFSLDFLKKYNLPEVANLDREAFRKSRLEYILPLVARRSCELAQYSFPKLGLSHVIAFSGFGTNGSTATMTTSSIKWVDNTWADDNGLGDGTVLKESSQWLGVLDDILQVQPVKASHMKILDDEAVKVRIQTAIHSIARRTLMELRQSDPSAYQQVIGKMGAQGSLFWTPPDDEASANEARMINRDILQKLGFSVEAVAEAAKVARNRVGGASDVSFVLNDYVANTDGFNATQRSFAENAAAAELRNLGYEGLAKTRYDKFIPKVLELQGGAGGQLSPKLVEDLRRSTGNAFNNRGVILWNSGDLDAAAKDFETGATFGSQKAIHNLRQLQQFQIND